jgi:molybdenum cofactor cytidylyltransferase
MGIPSVAAVVLAAGASHRLGRPKALVTLGGFPLIWWSCHHLEKAGCSPIVVVVHQDLVNDVKSWIPQVQLVVNPSPDEGRTGSLQCGLQALEEVHGPMQRVVMAPVDRPGWNASVVAGLMRRFNSVCVGFNGQRGHPVCLDREAIDAILKATPTTPLRKLVPFEPVELTAPFLTLNIDSEQDVAHLLNEETALLDYFAEGEEI